MARRKQAETQSTEENVNVTPAVNEENANVNDENKTQSEDANVQSEPAESQVPVQENPTEDGVDENKTDSEEDEEVRKEDDEEVKTEVVSSNTKVADDTEKLISRISILEHTFDKKIIERGVYDVYQKGNMWIFKDRNGRELSTHFGEIETALKLFVVRMFPLNTRAKGSTFTWAEVE